MRRFWVSLFCLLALTLVPMPAAAQAPLSAAELEVDLWPEYDRADVLVIYRVRLAADTPLPARVSLRIPRAAGEPYNVAWKESGSLLNMDYESIIQGDWINLEFTTPSPEFQVEYYDPRLQREQDRRSFEYRWPGDFAVGNVTVLVQQPVNALDWVTKPDMGVGKSGADGLTYYTYSIGAVKDGELFVVSFAYEKPDNILSVSAGGSVTPGEPVVAPGPQTAFAEVFPWLLGVLGVVLILGGGFWFIRSGRHRADEPRRRHGKTANDAAEVYCHNCGRRSVGSDLYCRGCGTRLRQEQQG